MNKNTAYLQIYFFDYIFSNNIPNQLSKIDRDQNYNDLKYCCFSNTHLFIN